MKYGENTKLVEEVIEYIQKRNLFDRKDIKLYSLLNDIEIIHDFDRAQELAWSQDLDVIQVVWDDIKSDESAKILEGTYNPDMEVQKDMLYEVFSNNQNYSQDFISINHINIIEEVERDLEMCALNRLLNGKTNNFYELIFEIYKFGGWPCGWKGEYPQGKMIVYLPEKE
ncbi:cytoplasmic protein [Bacillus sp. Xin]|uniref:cytoplasmic protein n=1 Tax=unclassified Bacillus (in: firmicutes) TaxID=185979 RepID=UPI0015738E5E|nr:MULTISPECIES: cytoplasmic protein [unclassified Bacillus (in: firmicutes)]MBC6972251.1 cytoplasmic protein [Bacillus sp. Xin]NSW36818.1 cytoplasmic protein [Bacillus sp. Xin1]